MPEGTEMDGGLQTFRAAVIGLGFVGAGDQVSGDAIGQKVADLDGTHAQALTAHPQVQLVAGSSRDEGRRKRFEERRHIHKTYADWREMLRAEQPDIVSITTNSPYHAEITVDCAEAGIRAVFCEKPIATRLGDADRAIRACREHGTLLAVNHNRRWHPLWRSVRDEIAAGAIGEPHHAMVHWSTGRLGNIGTHWFDALRFLLGTDAQAVSGTLDPLLWPDCRGPAYRDPGGWGIVDFSSGVKGFVHAPQDARQPFVLRIVGSLGQVTACGGDALLQQWDGQTRTLSASRGRPSSMEIAVQEIVTCLTDGGRPACTGEDGLAALEIIVGFHVSDRQRGQWVQLPISGSDRELEVKIG
jgi:predicted dehydrogenase